MTVIDATNYFATKKKIKLDMNNNLVNNNAFRAYCDCIGFLAVEKFSKTEYYDTEIKDGHFNFETSDLIDTSMRQSVIDAMNNLVLELILECVNAKVKMNVQYIGSNNLVIGNPEKVSLKIKINVAAND